ncbi:hypothetical protein GCM10027035_46820 [Emticicia sediminis]
MATNAPNDLTYFLYLKNERKDDLVALRHWSNLKIGFEGDGIWLKDFDYLQINSIEVKQIPYKKIFYSKDSKLFLYGSLLPEQDIPALLWTPIERGLPINLPSFNHNFFGITQKLKIQLVASNTEQEIVALLLKAEILKEYVEAAPAIRLQNLHWVVINQTDCLVIGRPLLPIQGNVFWRNSNSLIPAGFDFEWPILSEKVNQIVNPNSKDLVVWNTNSTYFLIAKESIKPLTISSFRQTFAQQTQHGF